MAFVVLVIDVPNNSISQLNADMQRPGNPHVAIVQARNELDAILGGAKDAAIQVTVRDTDPSVATSGSGSTQFLYNLK